MAVEKKVSIYNPFADAFCEVELDVAERLLAEVENIKSKIEDKKIELAKEAAYVNSLKKEE